MRIPNPLLELTPSTLSENNWIIPEFSVKK